MKSLLLRAIKGEKVERTPIWIMRQAGRYSPRYRKIREKVKNFMDLCRNPELAAEVTLIPIEEIGVDAAILFSDILVVVDAMGLNVSFVEGKGPVIQRLKSEDDIKKLHICELDDLSYVFETIRIVKENLKDKPLIGFSGAPFTLASYMIEGGSSRNYIATKSLMWNQPKLWHLLMEKLSKSIIRYLSAQADAGVDVVQIFDSWVGVLSREDYERYVFPYVKHIVDSFKVAHSDIPVIIFGLNTFHLIDILNSLNVDVIGLDYKTDIKSALKTIRSKAIQGNLDPVMLFADDDVLRKRVEEILIEGLKAKGHIFNLGHGILPSTDVGKAKLLVDMVHEISEKIRKDFHNTH